MLPVLLLVSVGSTARPGLQHCCRHTYCRCLAWSRLSFISNSRQGRGWEVDAAMTLAERARRLYGMCIHMHLHSRLCIWLLHPTATGWLSVVAGVTFSVVATEAGCHHHRGRPSSCLGQQHWHWWGGELSPASARPGKVRCLAHHAARQSRLRAIPSSSMAAEQHFIMHARTKAANKLESAHL